MNEDNLIKFLYILLRDHLPSGKVESIMEQHIEKYESREVCEVLYSNPWVAEHAQWITRRLLYPNIQPPQGKKKHRRAKHQ